MRTITVHGQTHSLIPIRAFRTQYNLPQTFGVALFEPKDYTGLAALDHAGTELQRLRANVLAAVPTALSRMDLLATADRLQEVFENELRAVNPRIGLREPEVEFAVAGFGDVCRAWAYALIRGKGAAPDFASVYAAWLNDSVRISTQAHVYTHQEETWSLRILNAIYGRMGLEVTMSSETAYVADSVYTCPAEGFMASLLQEVAERLVGA